MPRRGRPSSLHAAQSQITSYFENLRRKAFTEQDLGKIFFQRQGEWRLAATTPVDAFLRFLLEATPMRMVSILPTGKVSYRTITRYVWAKASPYAVAAVLEPRAYLSHGTAVLLHGLTDQLPHTICVSREQSLQHYKSESELTQSAIDKAFSQPARRSNSTFKYDGFEFVLLQGKNSGRLEVGSMEFQGESLPVTKLERTLIDISVRPEYAGGVYQVLEAFRRAKADISIGVLSATLKKMEYIYPYHQTIGFYMQRAGYQPEQYERLRNLELHYDFYLAHGLRDLAYDPEWRLHYPKGF